MYRHSVCHMCDRNRLNKLLKSVFMTRINVCFNVSYHMRSRLGVKKAMQ